MSTEWLRIVNTTINDYITGEENNVMRNRKLLALLQSKGRVTFNHSGILMDWKVRYRRSPMAGFADMDTLTFSRQNRHKTAQLEWRGYSMSEFFSDFEKEKNKGTPAIIKAFSELAAQMMDDMEDQFGDELYIDGTTAANSKRFHGIESFLSNSGASASAPIGVNNSTYAGISTALAAYGGNWTGSWPTGSGDAVYDFWTPLIVDYTSAVATASGGWQATTKTWPNTCLEALRFAIIKVKKNKSKRDQTDLITINDELYRLFLDKLQSEERIVATKESPLYKLGFTDIENFDGVDVTTEYGIPAATGYGWCMDALELKSLKGKIFNPLGPIYDEATVGYRLSLITMGNLQTKSPRNFFKLKNVS